MKVFATSVLFALALVGAGCSGCTTPVSNTQGVLSGILVDDKALYVAEAAFNGANQASIAAVNAGLLKPGGADAVKIADALKDAHDALTLAQAAYKAGDAKTYADKISAAQTLLATAWRLVPQKGA